jgi:hypothetical protein
MTSSTDGWVLPIGMMPKQYPGQALDGLASWADSMGCGQVSSSLYFFQFQIFFFSFNFLF